MRSYLVAGPLAATVLLLACAARGDEAADDVASEPIGAANGLVPQPIEEYEQGYALAYDESRQLANLQALLVKGQRGEIDAVTRDLARAAESIIENLEAFTESRPSISLHKSALPPVEAGARVRMDKKMRRDLLLATGCYFEKRLLFVEGMRVSKLAALIEEMTAGARDTDEGEFWQSLGEQLIEPHDRVLALSADDCAAG